MASHSLDVYGKGTAVWFPDEKDGWISAQLTVKNVSGDNVKLAFVTADGKVVIYIVEYND
jgi:myosin V